MKTRALIVTAVLLFIMSIPLYAQDTPLTKPPSTSPGVTRNSTAPAKKFLLSDKIYDLATGAVSGDRVRGPRRIIAKNLNTLRYNYTLSRVVSITPSVDLWSKLLSVSAIEMGKVPTVTPPHDQGP